MTLRKAEVLRIGICLLLLGASRGQGQTAQTSTLETERALLLAVKKSIDNWSDFSSANKIHGWDKTSQCSWTGVNCNAQGFVTELNLGCNGCQRQAIGSIDPDLGNFTALQILDFSNNYLTGPLPEAWSQSTMMQSLRSMNLSHNRLTGTLPAWSDAFAFPSLLNLDLSYNQLSGPLPGPWGDSSAFGILQSMDLRHNLLTGELPLEWGDADDDDDGWQALQELWLDSNNLTGVIPDLWVEGMAFLSLEVLALGHNSLEGPVPVGFGEPPASLRFLDLSYNPSLQGILPSNWSEEGTSNMTELYLNNCNFEGVLPDSWGSPNAFQNLQVLDLHGNHLVGPMPSSWGSQGSFPALTTLNLEQNWLMDSWGSKVAFPSLRQLFLGYNALFRQLPDEWGQNGSFASLLTLDLTANYLTGTLPASWGTPGAFPKLSNLSLVWNRLSSSVPATWSSLPMLDTLWVQPGNYQLCKGLPSGSNARLCKNLGTGCIQQSSLGQTCAISPPTSACYLPPTTTATLMLVTLRLQNSSRISEDGLENSLGPALLYVMTTSSTAQVMQFSRAGSGPTSYDVTDYHNSRRMLLAAEDDLYAKAWQGDRDDLSYEARRMLQAPEAAAAPTSQFPNILDAVIMLTAANGSNVNKMEEQLLTVMASNALVNVLGNAGVKVSSIQLLAVEPANPSDVPSWWQAAWSAHMIEPPVTSAEDPAASASQGDKDTAATVVAATVTSVFALALAIAGAAIYTIRRRRRLASADAEKATAADMSLETDTEDAATSQEASPHAQRSSLDAAVAASMSSHGKDMDGSMARRQASLISTASRRLSRHSLEGDPPALVALQRRRTSKEEPGEFETGPATTLSLPAMPWSDWEISSSDIQICKRPNGADWELGSGSFGKVYKAMRSSSQPVAVKVLHDRDDCPDFGQEIALLKACRHSNIVAFQGACIQDGRTMLVTEFMEGGDLFRALSHVTARKMLQWRCCGQNIALDIARGLHFLHNHNVVHFDLKSHNILLSREGTAKITDVGLARIIQDGYISKLDNVVGTFAWAAPELLLGTRCTEKIDIYSFGVLLWELAVTSHSGERPTRGQLREVRVPEELPAEVEELRQDCMEGDPKLRPSAKQVYERLAASR